MRWSWDSSTLACWSDASGNRFTSAEWRVAERWAWHGWHMGVPEWLLLDYALKKMAEGRNTK